MATVVPFRGWRYDLTRVESLAKVTAPPYDIITPAMQARLFERSLYNAVRADLNPKTPHDTEQDNPYTRAAGVLRQWKKDGILTRDPVPRLTVVKEDYTGLDGRAHTRRGVMALLRLQEFSEPGVFPHEATIAVEKRDRFQLMWTTEMSLSPIFMLHPTPGQDLMALWDGLDEAGDPPWGDMTDDDGNRVQVWLTENPEFLEMIVSGLDTVPMLIADGHHRYETGLFYRNSRYAQGDGPGPWDYCLVYLVDMADEGLSIYGTHRLVNGLPPVTVNMLPRSLATDFFIRRLTTDPAAAPEAISAYLTQHEAKGGAFGLYVSDLGASYGMVLKDRSALRGTEDEEGEEHSAAWRNLDVSILQSLVLDKVLGISIQDIGAGRHVAFCKEWDEAFRLLRNGGGQACFFMNPTKMSEVREVAVECGERMPQKSTYFYPKVPTGLVFYDLRPEEPPSDAM